MPAKTKITKQCTLFANMGACNCIGCNFCHDNGLVKIRKDEILGKSQALIGERWPII